jgi:large subunit ribosomal protein L29
MKIREWEQVRELGLPELKSREHELTEQVFKLRMQKSLGQIDNPLKLRETRRQIARIKTLIGEKERASTVKAGAPAAER